MQNVPKVSNLGISKLTNFSPQNVQQLIIIMQISKIRTTYVPKNSQHTHLEQERKIPEDGIDPERLYQSTTVNTSTA